MIRLKNFIILAIFLSALSFYMITSLWNWSMKKAEAKERYDRTVQLLESKKSNLVALKRTLAVEKERFKKIEHLVINSADVEETMTSLKKIIELPQYQFIDLELKSIKPDPKWLNIAVIELNVQQRSMIPVDVSANMLCSLLNSMYKVHKKECVRDQDKFIFKLIKD